MLLKCSCLTFAQLSAESAIVLWPIPLLNCFVSLCIASSPDPGGTGLGTVREPLFSIYSEIVHCVIMLAPFTGSFPSSITSSCAQLLTAEDILWFHLNFLSQRRVWRMHNYCQEYHYQTCSLLAAQLVV